jgi:hypothetical protein
MKAWAVARGLVLACAFGAVGCDAASAGDPAPNAEQGGQPPTTPNGGQVPTKPDDVESVGGAGDPRAEPCLLDPQPWCLTSCASDVGVDGVCVNDEWRCPEGTVNAVSCEPDSCGLHRVRCCADNGENTEPACGADGLFVACPSSATRNSGICVPAGLGIESCRELQSGSKCASEDLTCFTPGCSGGKCDCERDEESGELTWHCRWNAC